MRSEPLTLSPSDEPLAAWRSPRPWVARQRFLNLETVAALRRLGDAGASDPYSSITQQFLDRAAERIATLARDAGSQALRAEAQCLKGLSGTIRAAHVAPRAF